MKKITPLLLLIGLVNLLSAQSVGVNDNGASPNGNAILDVDVSTNDKGVMIPRLTTAQRTAMNGSLGVTEEGLTVFDETTSSFWFWDGTTWYEMLHDGSGWKLSGNSGTTAGTDFLGTTDAQELSIKTNNAEAIRIQTDGDVGIGTASPSEKLEVDGNELVTGDIYVNTAATSSIHYGSNGNLGATTTFDPNSGASGLWIEGNNGSESGGIFMNGNMMALWSPGDADILRVYDEDNFGQGSLFTVTGNGSLDIEKGVLFDCGSCGSTSTIAGTSDWGDLIIQGRVLSTNSNLHLSPPNGSKVIINTNYRAAGGATGTSGLEIQDGGIRMNKSYYYYQRYFYTTSSSGYDGSGNYNLGSWDFCAVGHVGFKNNQSSTDEDDDVQCAVYPNGAGYGEQSTYAYNFSETYNSKRTWYLYLEAYEDTNGITCAANCMNFE